MVVIGAGAAGLAATAVLKQAGAEVCCVEASGRIGGRIYTVHDREAPLPIELGAEFVHGRPPEIWDLIRARSLCAYEHTARALYFDHGRIRKDSEVGAPAGRVFEKMAKSSRQHDESFEQYLRRSHHQPDAKDWARVFVEGFNAARSDSISVASLESESEAADKIDGDRAFRIADGFDAIAHALLQSIPDHPSIVQLNTPVEHVVWRRGQATLECSPGVDGARLRFRCRRVVVTAPLGVLQTGGIRFDPEPVAALRAARALRFGQVYRLTLRFADRFWEENPKLRDTGFLVSKDRHFFTWWTMHPVIAPLLTAWMAGTAADGFRPPSDAVAVRSALASLGRILQIEPPRPEAFYFHNWRSDPYFRGAYSYVPAGAAGAREALAAPESGTLYFAGEAAAVDGHGSTVHGAIAAGRRAGWLVLGKRS